MGLPGPDGLHGCAGFGRPPHRAPFADMAKDRTEPGGAGAYCKACLRDRARSRYRSDDAARARQLASNARTQRRRRLADIARLRQATRYHVGVVVEVKPRTGGASSLLVLTPAGPMCCTGPASLGDGEFVAVRIRPALPQARNPGHRHGRVARPARLLMNVTKETGERLLALQRAYLWAAMTEHDREGSTFERQFAGIDLMLARAYGQAQRHRRLVEEQDAQPELCGADDGG